MTYRPMLFNTPMVCAIEDGTKTQTRRLVQLPKNKDWELLDVHPNPDLPGMFWQAEINGTLTDVKKRFTLGIKAPCAAGDVLWVRETWMPGRFDKPKSAVPVDWKELGFFYFARDEIHNTDGSPVLWRPSIHMPKEAARIFLRVDEVRAERLHKSFFRYGDIVLTIAAEGIDVGVQCRECIDTYGCPCCIDSESECGVLDDIRDDFARLWDSTIKPAALPRFGWASNPWVWVIKFTRTERPEGWGR